MKYEDPLKNLHYVKIRNEMAEFLPAISFLISYFKLFYRFKPDNVAPITGCDHFDI